MTYQTPSPYSMTFLQQSDAPGLSHWYRKFGVRHATTLELGVIQALNDIRRTLSIEI